jgi:glutathione S-transferase
MYAVSKNEDGTWSRAAWTDVKHSLGYDFPNLPYYEDGKVKLSETSAIMRYICK